MYHFFSWSYGHYDASTFLGKLGIYGVSVFYVPSGLTLYLVYGDRLHLHTVKGFFIKRVFRILPLVWLHIALCMIILTKKYDLWRVMLNLSFGKNLNFMLSKLGEISYSLYLLHPFVFAWIMQIFGYGDVPAQYAHWFIISSIFFTIVLSLEVYNQYEKRFIAYSRKLAKRS